MEELIKDLGPEEIQKYQQNRYPLLFVDKITEACPGKYAKGYKLFTYDEWFFPAHFEDEPNVPGFVQVETLTQVFIMTFLTIDEYKGKKTGFVSIDGMKFRKKIVPGDKLEMEATLESFRRGLAKGYVVGTIDGEVACKLSLTVTIPDVMTEYRPKSAE